MPMQERMPRPCRTNRFTRSASSLALALLGLALLWASAASADAPVAMSESARIANPTTVQLEATAAGETEMTFAIATGPALGSLGQVSSPTCQPTGTGGTDCTATVAYTPNQCTNGPDSFTYTATDLASTTTSSPATVTLAPGPDAPSAPPAPSLLATAAATAGATFTATVRSALAGASVDYGDGGGSQALSVDSSGDAPLSHVYAAEGTYTLTATNHGSCGLTAGA